MFYIFIVVLQAIFIKKGNSVLAKLYESYLDIHINDSTIDFLIDWSCDEQSFQKELVMKRLVSIRVYSSSAVWLNDLGVVEVTIVLEKSFNILFEVAHFRDLIIFQCTAGVKLRWPAFNNNENYAFVRIQYY